MRDALQCLLGRTVEMEDPDLKTLSNVADDVPCSLRLSSSVYKEAFRKARRKGVGQDLVQVRIHEPDDAQPIVLRVAHEQATITLPPREVRFKPDATSLVKHEV